MNVVFVHDHKFRNINGVYYSTGALSDSVLTRYTDIFGTVSVIARVVSKQGGDHRLSEIKNPNIKIINAEWKDNKIEQYIKGCDAVIIRLPSFTGNKVFKYVKKYNKPYLIEVVACAWGSFWNHSLLGKLIAPYMFYMTKNIAKCSPYAIYVTNEFLQKRYPCNGVTVGVSDVELSAFDHSILREREKRIKSMHKKILIGTLAAVNVRYKGQEYIIKAISRLNREGYNFEYELVGGGDSSYLKSVAAEYGVEDKVHFIGTLSHDKVFEWLDTIDIYSQPSKIEGLPRSLIEAMSRACPAIGSNVGGIPELLNNKSIFQNGNIDGICEILIKITNHKQCIYELAKENFIKAMNFRKEILDVLRKKIYKDFCDYVKIQKKKAIN